MAIVVKWLTHSVVVRAFAGSNPVSRPIFFMLFIYNRYMKTLDIMGYEIPIYIKDNNSNKTLLFIHGFHSSHEFIGRVKNLDNNYNIISFSMPGSQFVAAREELSVELLTGVAREVLNQVKSSKVYILGHSLGGFIASELGKLKRVKKVFYLSPIHPQIVNGQLYKVLKSTLKPETRKEMILSKVIMSGMNIAKYIADPSSRKFIDPKNPWFSISKNDLLNDGLIRETLRQNYLLTLNKSYYICGDKDNVISTPDFIYFVQEELGKKVKIIEAGHSPCLENAFSTNETLNNRIKFRKRFWASKRKIIK